MRRISDRLTCRLREWRTSNGFSLADVADLSGYSVPTLSRIERGIFLPKAQTKLRIARSLGVPMRDLFDPDPDLPPITDEAAQVGGQS